MKAAVLRSWWGRAALITASLVLLLAVALGILLGSAGGRALLLRGVERALATAGVTVELEGLGPGLPWRLQLQRLALADDDGIWLETRQLVAAWKLGPLLGGRLHLTELRAQQLEWRRWPQPTAPEEAEEEAAGLQLPALPPVRLQQLAVDRLLLGEAIAGHSLQLSLQGELTATETTFGGRLEVQDRQRPQDRLQLQGTLARPQRRLQLEGTLNEDPGGAMAALLGLPATSGVRLQLSGDGPLADWQGELRGSAGAAATLAMQLQLAEAEELGFRLQGALRLQRAQLQPPLSALPTERLELQLQGRLGEERLQLETLTLDTPEGRLSAQGSWSWAAARLEGRFEVQPQTPLHLPEANLRLAEARLSGTLQGTAQALTVELQLHTGEAQLATVTAAELRLETQLDLPLPPARWPQLTGEGRLHGEGVRLGDGGWPGAVSGRFRLRGDGEGRYTVRELQLTAAGASLTGDGSIHLARQRLNYHLNANLDDVSSWPALAGISGRLQARAQGQGELAPLALRTELTLQGDRLAGLPAPLPELLGPTPQLTAQTQLDAGSLRLEQLALEAPMRGDGEGVLRWDTPELAADFRLQLPPFPFPGGELPQGGAVSGRLTGVPDDFTLELQAQAPQLRQAELQAQELSLHGRLSGLPERVGGRAELDFRLRDEPFHLTGALQVAEEALRLEKVTLQGAGLSAEFAGQVVRTSGLVTGTLTAQAAQLAPLGRLLDIELAGQAQGRAVFAATSAGQQLKLQLSGTRLTAAGWSAAQLQATAALPLSELPAGASGNLVLTELSRGPARFAQARLQGSGTAQGLRLQLAVDEQPPFALGGQAEALLDRQEKAWRCTLRRLSGSWSDKKFALAAPTTLQLQPQQLRWDALRLTVGEGQLTMTAGQLAADRADARLRLRDLPLATFNPWLAEPLSGQLAADLTVAGSGAAPQLEGRLTLSEVRSRRRQSEEEPPLTLQLDVDYADGRAHASARLTDAAERRRGEATLTLPLQLTLIPPALTVAPTAPLQGRLEAEAGLSFLAPFLDLRGQELAGDLSVTLNLAGTWRQPQVAGTAQLAQGQYENVRSGTLLTGIDGEAALEGEQVRFELQGTDGEGGSVKATGRVGVAPPFAFRVDLASDRCRLLRQKLVQAQVQGKARLEGDLAASRLSGELRLDPTEVQLPRQLPPELTVLEVEQIHRPPELSQPSTPSPAAGPHRLTLDLGVAMPARFFVRGRGLESEWSGRLQLAGTAAEPRINGRLQLLRGRYQFLDRQFTLRNGTLQFTGETPPAPILDVTGEARVREITAEVRLSGRLPSPAVSIGSTPALPEDEVLALILFGRSTTQISPLQALSLARAASELAGGGGGPDLLGQLRETLGVQELNVGQTEEGETAVGVGAYLGGRYYIHTQRSITGQTEVEVELTPNLSLETQTGGERQGGAGILWRRDY